MNVTDPPAPSDGGIPTPPLPQNDLLAPTAEGESINHDDPPARIPTPPPPPILEHPPPTPQSDTTRPSHLLDFTTLPGNPFPPQASDVLWPGGSVKTKLPWISDPEDPQKNILQNVSFLFIL